MLRTIFPLARQMLKKITYFINDDFSVDAPAGGVDNTQALPIGGIRHGVDANSKLSISSGALQFATGGVNNQDRVYYDTVVRALGLMYLATTFSSSNAFSYELCKIPSIWS